MVVTPQRPSTKFLGKRFILGTILKADKNNIYYNFNEMEMTASIN